MCFGVYHQLEYESTSKMISVPHNIELVLISEGGTEVIY